MIKLNKNQFIPDYVSPPGETLLEILESRQMTQADLAIRTGRTKKHINSIIKGKAPITPETSLQLERVLAIPANFWNKREQDYQEALARINEQEKLKKDIAWLDKIPVKSMVNLKWIKSLPNRIDQMREVLKFFGVASPTQWDRWLEEYPEANFRKSPTFKSNPSAVAAWLRKGLLNAQEIHCAPYKASEFQNILHGMRSLTLEPPEVFQPQMIQLCASVGVAVVFVPELPKLRISGATLWLTPTKALIQLSLRHKTDDHFWFTFFHEAGHILKHGKTDFFLEDETCGDKQKEDEANKFASSILIPQRAFKNFISRNRRFSKEAIKEFSSQIGISSGIVVGRLQHEKLIPHSHCNDLKRSFRWA